MKRYHVMIFPAWQGKPWRFKSKVMALVVARLRLFLAFIRYELLEVRVVDVETGEHIKVL